MHRYRVLVFIFTFIHLIGFAQDKKFPTLEGDLLTGERISFPVKADLQAYLVGMAYSKAAEVDLETWFQPSFDKFILKKGLFDGTYQVKPLFIPMFTGFNRAAERTVSKDLEEQIPDEFKANVLIYRGPLEPYKTSLQLVNKNQPYILLVTPDGDILYQTSGAFSEKKMERIADLLDQL